MMNLFFKFIKENKDSKESQYTELLMLKHILIQPKVLKKIKKSKDFDTLIRIGIKHEIYEVCDLVKKQKYLRNDEKM